MNTVTSLSFSELTPVRLRVEGPINLGWVVAYGIHAIHRFKRQNVGVFSSENWAYWGLIFVGLASAGYHTTLKYETQMCTCFRTFRCLICAQKLLKSTNIPIFVVPKTYVSCSR